METVARGFEVQGLLESSYWKYCKRILKRAYAPLNRAENALLRMRNFSTMADQVLFFMLADKVLLRADQRTTSLYTLMFYNVIAYCIGYIKELITKEDWTPYVTVTETSQMKHLAMSAIKIGLEWTKAVTFIITLIFTLLVFGLEQGLQNYKPSLPYVVITWAYYMATEKVFVDLFPPILTYFEFDTLESLENLYAPVILRLFTISLSALFALILLPFAPLRFLFVTTYLNVFLRSKEFILTYWAVLQKERRVLIKYRHATADEIKTFDDVCAVCLCPMRKARVTPCHHLFHASCLRLCVKTSDHCPICKRQLDFM